MGRGRHCIEQQDKRPLEAILVDERRLVWGVAIFTETAFTGTDYQLSNASEIYFGDFSRVLVGMRTRIVIEAFRSGTVGSDIPAIRGLPWNQRH